MPVRRDSNGRFAGGSGGGSKRASRASKKMGAVKPRTASTDRSKVTTSKVAGKGRVGQTASKIVRTQGAANQVKAAKFDTATRDQAMSKRVNMNKAPGLAGAASRKASMDRSPDRVKGGLKKAANVAGRDAIKAEGLKAITGDRRYKRKNKRK